MVSTTKGLCVKTKNLFLYSLSLFHIYTHTKPYQTIPNHIKPYKPVMYRKISNQPNSKLLKVNFDFWIPSNCRVLGLHFSHKFTLQLVSWISLDFKVKNCLQIRAFDKIRGYGGIRVQKRALIINILKLS